MISLNNKVKPFFQLRNRLDVSLLVNVNTRKVAIVGLGYVGLMIASTFGKNEAVIGFDISETRINALKQGDDINAEVSPKELAKVDIKYTTNPEDLKAANFYIIAVPTPLNKTKHPDHSILLAATKMVGTYLKQGDIVVYESSVYPGATEEECIPVLEQVSHLICGEDFGVGYSPERINPADKEHTLGNIPKIIAAIDNETLEVIDDVYRNRGVPLTYKVSSIRVAEATKVIENIQRDLNISLVNEVAFILHKLKMDSVEVFEAMQTKWNCLPFRPGLVGGHCIPVNSYYLAHRAEEAGFHPEVILAGRRTNEQMPKFLADSTIKELIHMGVQIKGARIAVLGLAYKENVSDVHDSRIIDLIQELRSFDTEILVHDPLADIIAAKRVHGVDLVPWEALTDIDAVVLVVGHKQFANMTEAKLKPVFKAEGLIVDAKGMIDPNEFKGSSIKVWRL